MDNECSLEGIKATLNVEKQAYMAVPLNRYKTLPEQTKDYLKNEFDVSDHSNRESRFSFL